jgi:hypothetical protein
LFDRPKPTAGCSASGRRFLFGILIKPNNFTYSAPKFVVLNYYLNQFSWFEIYSKHYTYYTMTMFITSYGLRNTIMTNMEETATPFRKITDYWVQKAQTSILRNCKYKINLICQVKSKKLLTE